MRTPIKIKLTQACRLALKASLLYGKSHLPKGKEGIQAVINHLGYIQMDTISVVERAHNHILWTRCPDFKPENLHQLQAVDRTIFEYWGHAMSYLPMDDYRFYMHDFKRFKKPSDKWSRMRIEKTKSICPKVMKRIRNEGALGSKDFESTGTQKAKGWWEFKPSKIALELLYWQGKLMISERQNFHRKYDLTERVLPKEINIKFPTQKEQAHFWIYRALQSLGVANVSEIKKHLYHCDKILIVKELERLLKSSEVMILKIDGIDEDYYAIRENFESNYPLKKQADKLHVLSPFDNAVINRDRLLKLFDFDYKIECYVPQPKRKYGYFIHLILWGDKFVGRLDAKAERKSRELIVHDIYLEKNFKPTQSFTDALLTKLQSFAKFNKCTNLILKKTSPNSYHTELSKHL